MLSAMRRCFVSAWRCLEPPGLPLTSQVVDELDGSVSAEAGCWQEYQINQKLWHLKFYILYLVITCASSLQSATKWQQQSEQAFWDRLASLVLRSIQFVGTLQVMIFFKSCKRVQSGYRTKTFLLCVPLVLQIVCGALWDTHIRKALYQVAGAGDMKFELLVNRRCLDFCHRGNTTESFGHEEWHLEPEYVHVWPPGMIDTFNLAYVLIEFLYLSLFATPFCSGMVACMAWLCSYIPTSIACFCFLYPELATPEQAFANPFVFVVLMAAGISTAMSRQSDQVKKRLVILAKCTGDAAVQERVLRYQAEFHLENSLQSRIGEDEVAPGHGSDTISTAAVSARTSPPVFLQRGDPSIGCSHACKAQGELDCLPGSMQVQLERERGPSKLTDVLAGQSVLCRDHLTNMVVYQKITAVRQHQARRECVHLHLEDGTTLTMTADHPVRVQDTTPYSLVLPAGDLDASKHKVKCLRQVDLAVCRIELAEPVAAVYLRHPERYELLAAPPDSASLHTHAIPVGSADLSIDHCKQNREISPFPENHGPRAIAEGRNPTLKRCSSAPGALFVTPFQVDSSDVGTCLTSSCSASDVDFEARGVELTKLSVVQHTKAQGVPTVGSLYHPSFCTPCRYENCKKGILCQYCHLDHSHLAPLSSKDRRARALKRSELTGTAGT